MQPKLGEGARLPTASPALPVGSQPRATAAPAGLGQEVRVCRGQWGTERKHPNSGCRLHRWGPRAAGRACPQPCAADGSGRWTPVPAGPSLCPGLSLPICKAAPRKPSLEDPGEEFPDGTYRRISCLVRNVKSWKAEQEAVSGPPGGRARPPRLRSRAQASAQAPRGPESRAPGTRPVAPWTGGCPSPPSPSRAHSSANSSRDAGNFLTSAPPSGRVTAPSPRQPPLGPASPGPPPP